MMPPAGEARRRHGARAPGGTFTRPGLFQIDMTHHTRAISIVAAILLLGNGIAAELLHTETVVIAGTGAALARHACGEKERHIPLDQIHLCAACLASMERNAIPPLLRGGEAILPSSPGVHPRSIPTFPFVHTSSSSRAPPRHS